MSGLHIEACDLFMRTFDLEEGVRGIPDGRSGPWVILHVETTVAKYIEVTDEEVVKDVLDLNRRTANGLGCTIVAIHCSTNCL